MTRDDGAGERMGTEKGERVGEGDATTGPPEDAPPTEVPEEDAATGGDEALSPDRAFSLLGNPTRLAVLRALREADGPLTFSELQDRVGMADSGGFSYHLRRLTETYVDHGEGGYELTRAGGYLMSAILAGAVDGRPRLGTFPVKGTCTTCGGDLEAEFEDEGIVRCRECGATVMSDAFPPAGGTDRTPEEIVRAFDDWLFHRFRLASRGTCPQCAAPVEATVLLDPDAEPSARGEHRCRNCKHTETASVFLYVLDHPAVVSLFYDRGIDLRSLPCWERRPHLREFTEEVLAEDPPAGASHRPGRGRPARPDARRGPRRRGGRGTGRRVAVPVAGPPTRPTPNRDGGRGCPQPDRSPPGLSAT